MNMIPKCQEPSMLLPVNRSGETVHLDAAAALMQQYEILNQSANHTAMEMMKFGAMLDVVDDALTTRRFNPNSEGVSLQSWLAAHCPTINYNTAMSWLYASRGLRKVAKLAASRPLLALMGEEPLDDEKMERERQRVIKAMSEHSMSFLRKALKEPTGAGRPKGTTATRPTVRRTDADAAHEIWGRLITSITKERGAYFSAAALLTVDDATAAKEELTMLLGALDQRIKEG